MLNHSPLMVKPLVYQLSLAADGNVWQNHMSLSRAMVKPQDTVGCPFDSGYYWISPIIGGFPIGNGYELRWFVGTTISGKPHMSTSYNQYEAEAYFDIWPLSMKTKVYKSWPYVNPILGWGVYLHSLDSMALVHIKHSGNALTLYK